MLHLYELTEQLKTLVDFIEEHGEEPAAWSVAFEELTGNFQDKAVNMAKLIRTWEAEEEVYKAEIARLQAHAKASQGKQAWGKEYLRQNMEHAGIDHIKGDVIDIRLQNSPPSVEVLDWAKVPIDYVDGKVDTMSWRQVVALGLSAQPVVVKQLILDEWKRNQQPIPGVTIEQKRHVRIR